jgi:hypothetical protein
MGSSWQGIDGRTTIPQAIDGGDTKTRKGGIMLWTILIILAIIALVLFILGRRHI